MAAISYLFTLARVAEMLGEDEDLLHDISIEMEPEDGIVSVLGKGEDYTPAFNDDGIETLKLLLEMRRKTSQPRC